MKYLLFCCFTLIAISLSSCDLGPDSPRGFSLPKGDVDKGAMVLTKYQCLACHNLNGVEQAEGINNPDLNVRLGGKSTKVTTYAELVTSVINPSHKLAKGYALTAITVEGESKMSNFNDVMTVTELVDLVTFLQPHYELVPYRRTDYQFYHY
ncbi:cytochrome C [Colwellia sp. MB3u-70]|uniref:cytochrome C n=1 Tax=unclassified Colwellia TaxID=196834 RepID=UPI0015F4F657|nr:MULTISPECIES: cytochrome C [unclassified Colwellia]MBA6292116.1 cytochrome C [Colwellia sp. MB3u-8]MBA6309099.1 cytochrome C [Colwellia sp. MB3u-70]